MIDCTVIVAASYIPMHPSCEIIAETIDSLNNLQLPSNTPIILAHDHSDKPEYHEYLENLAARYKSRSDIKIVVRDTFGHLSGNIRNALEQVTTKYILIVQHDLSFRPGCNLGAVIEDMEHKPKLKHVRFNKRSNIKSGWDSRNDTFGKQLSSKNYVYTRTPAWSDNNHVCRADYYRNLIFKICGDGQPMESSIYKTVFYSSHARFGTYIFGPLGFGRMLNQRDGRNENKVVPLPTYTPTEPVDVKQSLKTIDVCLTGVLARSIAYTLDYFKVFIEMLSNAGHTVRLVVIANDPGDTPVDSSVVSHSDALALLRSKCKVHYVDTVMQSELDRVVAEREMLERLNWLTCHRPGKACNAVHMPNMMRHILIERQCADYLEDSDCDIAFSLSPDIHFDVDHVQLLEAINKLDDRTLIVPTSRAAKKFQVNGFVGGSRELMRQFLQRTLLDGPRPIPENEHIGWERTCFITREQLKAKQQMIPVDMVKIRANGDTKRAWACKGRDP